MMALDISHTLQAKSDQLNADDLLGGPITVTVTAVTEDKKGEGGPIVVRISGGHMPFRPCKTMRRLLADQWGADAERWKGRRMTLYRDAGVRFGGADVGGIRISHLSDIPRATTIQLTESKGGKKKGWTVRPLDASADAPASAPTANLDALLEQLELTDADCDRYRETQGKAPLATLDDTQRAQFAAWLAGNTTAIDAIRALIPPEQQ